MSYQILKVYKLCSAYIIVLYLALSYMAKESD